MTNKRLPNLNIVETKDIEEETFDILSSRIPLKSGNKRKLDYLSWRIIGFSVREACELAEITQKSVMHWRNSDPQFKDIECNRLPELQKTISNDILLLEWLRNYRLILRVDLAVITKAASGREYLNDREWEYFKLIRKHYTAAEKKIIEAAGVDDSPGQKIQADFTNVTFIIDGRPASHDERKVGIRQLMERFQLSKKMEEEEDTVEGQFRQLEAGNGSSD